MAVTPEAQLFLRLPSTVQMAVVDQADWLEQLLATATSKDQEDLQPKQDQQERPVSPDDEVDHPASDAKALPLRRAVKSVPSPLGGKRIILRKGTSPKPKETKPPARPDAKRSLTEPIRRTFKAPKHMKHSQSAPSLHQQLSHLEQRRTSSDPATHTLGLDFIDDAASSELVPSDNDRDSRARAKSDPEGEDEPEYFTQVF